MHYFVVKHAVLPIKEASPAGSIYKHVGTFMAWGRMEKFELKQSYLYELQLISFREIHLRVVTAS